MGEPVLVQLLQQVTSLVDEIQEQSLVFAWLRSAMDTTASGQPTELPSGVQTELFSESGTLQLRLRVGPVVYVTALNQDALLQLSDQMGRRIVLTWRTLKGIVDEAAVFCDKVDAASASPPAPVPAAAAQ